MQKTLSLSALLRTGSFLAVVVAGVVSGCASVPVESREPPEASLSSSATPVAPVNAVTPAESELSPKFQRWVSDFSIRARAAGIEESTLAAAFAEVKLLARVMESDRAQPEFTRNVWDYLDSAVSAQRVSRGQDKWLQWQPVLGPVVARYGVPAEILIAIWGMESSYGSFTGDISTIDALATLGFEGRREKWASGQLLAALKILQNGDIDRARMIGSWAGAMGQTQFLPSTYLTYAVDGDGDGKRDIWGSVSDVMASTANFVARSGWQPEQVWGTEVRLPVAFDYARADADVRQHSSQWGGEGVQTMDGTALPILNDSSILLPAGALGPAFLVGPNFRTILRYNNSTSYALAVSLLAQQLAGGVATQAPWPRDLLAMSRSQVQALQEALNAQGFDSGAPDGMLGPATRRAVRLYQRSQGLPADGYPTTDLLQHLQASAAAAQKPRQP